MLNVPNVHAGIPAQNTFGAKIWMKTNMKANPFWNPQQMLGRVLTSVIT